MTFEQALQLLLVILPFLLPPLIGVVTILVKSAMDKLPVTSRPVVAKVVQTAVVATEQVANSQLNGPGKKELAVQKVQEQLAHLGLNVPTSVVSSMIEEAVAALPKVGDAVVAGTVPDPTPVVTKALVEQIRLNTALPLQGSTSALKEA